MDRTRDWHSIDAQEYPFDVTVVVEFARDDPLSPSFFQRYIDFPENFNVAGLWWRAVPVNWPFVPVAPR